MAFAEAFRARFGADWPVLIAPLTEIRPLDGAMNLAGCDAVVFTSANAVSTFCRISARRDLPAWCVGPRTAEAAAAQGFRVTEGAGDARALAGQLIAGGGVRRVAYPRGAEVAFDLEKALDPAGIETISAILYDQVSCPVTDDLAAALACAEPHLLPLFSPASARRAVEAMASATAPLLVAAMSVRVADAAGPLHTRALRVADRPDAGAMLDALGALIAAGGSA